MCACVSLCALIYTTCVNVVIGCGLYLAILYKYSNISKQKLTANVRNYTRNRPHMGKVAQTHAQGKIFNGNPGIT